MEKMLFTTNGIGHQRRTAVEIIKIGDDFLGSTRAMTLQVKSRLASEQAPEETTEMITREAMNSEVITGMIHATGKIVGLGSQDLSCPLKR